MRRVLVIVLIFSGVCGCLCADQRQEEIKALPDAYRELGQGCLQVASFNCCMSSVRNMAQANGVLRKAGEDCPVGYRGEMLKCLDSYAWCEKVHEESPEVKNLPEEYQALGRACLKRPGFQCCIYSVEAMARDAGVVKEPGQPCPEGFLLKPSLHEAPQFLVSDIDAEKLRVALRGGRPVDEFIRQTMAPFVMDIESATQESYLAALKRVVSVKEFYRVAGGEAYRSMLEDIYVELLERALAGDGTLKEHDYVILNKALLRVMYPDGIRKSPECRGFLPWCQPRSR